MKRQHFLRSSALALRFLNCYHHSCYCSQATDSAAYYTNAICSPFTQATPFVNSAVHSMAVGRLALVRCTTSIAVCMRFNLKFTPNSYKACKKYY